MRVLYGYSLRRPISVLLFAGLTLAGLAPGLLRLKLRTDGAALVPAARPEVAYDRSVREAFHVEDPLIILIRSNHPDGIFNTGTLQLICSLTRDVRAFPEIPAWAVTSLATEHGHRVKPGTLEFREFLDPLPHEPGELVTLRRDLERIKLHMGTLVSQDGSSASILVEVPREEDRVALCNKIHRLATAQGPRTESIHLLGAPVAESLLGLHILEDLGLPRSFLGLEARQQSALQRLPGALFDLRRLIADSVGLLPIAVGVMALLFVIGFRSATAAMLPLIEVGACLLAVFGLMGYLGVPVYLTMAVMPILLTSMGVADEIHVFTRYRAALQEQPQAKRHEALLATLDEMWRPVVMTSVTTALGFLAFALSPLPPVRAFGVFTALGMVFCMLWTLTAIPAMLVLIDPSRFRPDKASLAGHSGRGRRAWVRLAQGIVRRRQLICLICLAAVCAVPFGAARVHVQDSWIDNFDPASEFRGATRHFNEQFLGTHVLLLQVETGGGMLRGTLPATNITHHGLRLSAEQTRNAGPLAGHSVALRLKRSGPDEDAASVLPGGARTWTARIESATVQDDLLVLQTDPGRGSPLHILRPEPADIIEYEVHIQPLRIPEVLERIGALERFIAGRVELTVGGVIGPFAYLSTAHLMSQGLAEEARSIPDEPAKLQWIWDRYERIRGTNRLGQLVDPAYSRCLVTVFLKNANFVAVRQLMAEIKAYEQEQLAPHGISLGFAGDVAVSQAMIDSVVQTQMRSLPASLLAILVVTALLSKSLTWGVLCTLPSVLTVAADFAFMGWSGMPLGVATSMFASMTLGIGVDYAIHLLERCRLLRRRGVAVEEAVVQALAATGPALVLDAMVISGGFGMLILSQVPANARLGALLVLSITGCLLLTMLLIPALVIMLRPAAVHGRPALEALGGSKFNTQP